jgi:hypothetical protein
MEAMKRPFFRSSAVGYVAGVSLVLAGAWCFHDAYGRRGKSPSWLVKTLTPGM